MKDSTANARAGVDPGALAAVACVVLPWVWPFAGGPTAAVLPWLVSCACAVLLLLVRVGVVINFLPVV